jgi:hypothetical protein
LVSTYAQDGLSTDQLDKAVLLGAVGVTLSISLEVAEVTDVTVRVGGGTVVLAEGVD